MLKRIFTKKIVSIITASTLIVGSVTYVSAYNNQNNVISLNNPEITIYENQTEVIEPVVDYGETYSYSDLKWFSSDTSVVTVDEQGNIIGVNEGEAKVLCTLQTETNRQHTAECNITVMEPDFSVKIENKSTSIYTGETLQYTASVEKNKDLETTTQWSTVNDTVATIDEEGKLTARNAGTTMVKYKLLDKEGNQLADSVVILEVKEPETTVELNYNDMLWNVGKTGTIKPEITSNDECEKEIKYMTSNAGVATVDSKGKVEAKKAGEAVITCQVLDKETKRVLATATTQIEVYNEVEDIDLNKTEVELALGKTFTFNYDISPANATNKEVEWTSSDTKIATVDKNGKVTPKKTGKVTITCKSKDEVGTKVKAEVIVYEPAKSLEITSTKTKVEIGKTITLSTEISPENAYNDDVVWKTSNSKIAKIDSKGKITGVSEGYVIVRATSKDSGEVTDTFKVTVTAPNQEPTPTTETKPSTTNASYTEDDLYCMAAVIWQEAGALYMSDELQLMVGSVVMNHVKSDYFPDTVREVLMVPGAYGRMAWDGIHLPTATDAATQQAIDRCYKNAEKVLTGQYDIPDNVIYQAGFKQGSGVYKYIEGVYFCYQ